MADSVHDPRYAHDPHPRREDDITVLGAILKRTSWGAVLAGAVAAISAQMVLTVLGIAIGVTTNEVISGPSRVEVGMQVAAAVWWLATGAVALLIGGCVVGRLTGMTRSSDVLLHGFTMWAVTALFGFMVVTAGAGALYGTSLDATYVGSRALYDGRTDPGAVPSTLSGGAAIDAAARDSTVGAVRPVTREAAQRYVQSASWWTLFALALGIAASLAGSWLAAPNRIAVRPPSERVA